MQVKSLKAISIVFTIAIVAVWVYSFMGGSASTMVFQNKQIGKNLSCEPPECKCWSGPVNLYFPDSNTWKNNVHFCGRTNF